MTLKRDIFLDKADSFAMVVENGDFKAQPGMDTAIWVSVYTDARASDSQVLRPELQRGWMGNLVSDVPDRQLGGLLWLLEQRRLTQDNANSAAAYVRACLNWMIEDVLLKKIDVTGEIVPLQGIAVTVILTSPKGDSRSHYIPLWEITGNAS